MGAAREARAPAPGGGSGPGPFLHPGGVPASIHAAPPGGERPSSPSFQGADLRDSRPSSDGRERGEDLQVNLRLLRGAGRDRLGDPRHLPLGGDPGVEGDLLGV